MFCVNDFPAKLFDFLEFYTVDPMWLTSANQDDYYLIKSGITPVTIDLGVYETVQDTKAITDNFSGIALAVSRALEHNHHQHLITVLQLYCITLVHHCIFVVLRYYSSTVILC